MRFPTNGPYMHCSSSEGRKISKDCEKTAGMIDRNCTKKLFKSLLN